MAYTQDDFAAVQQAIVALATGKRIASVRLSDNTFIQYEPADLGKLQALESESVPSSNPARDAGALL